jgi:hypothetical protein
MAVGSAERADSGADPEMAVTEKVEKIARALYVASGGNEDSFPWPCKRADYYRRLAEAAMKAWWSK